jgi:hypothetical protein
MSGVPHQQQRAAPPSTNANGGNGSSSGNNSSALPASPALIRRSSSSMAKPCCVVGCAVKREKDGYCMAHYKLFKQNLSPAEEAARAKLQAKQLADMEKERVRLDKADAAQRQKRSSAIHAAAGGADGGSPEGHSWWRRGSKTLGGRSCFAAPASPQGSQHPGSSRFMVEDASPLLLEVRSAWSTASKVVFKDLPRLAKRTSIQTEEMGTLIDSGRIVKIPKPVQILPLAAPAAAPVSTRSSSRIGRSHSFTLPAASASSSSSSSSAASASASTFTSAPLTHSSLLPSSSWESWSGLENEPWVVKEQQRRIFLEERERKRRRELEQYGGAIREEAAADEERKQDAQMDANEARREANLASPEPAVPYVDTHLSAPDVDTWQAVCNVLLCCLEQLEPTEVAFAARSALAVATSSMHQGSDHQSVLESIFTEYIGLQSRTFKVWQSIHQSILFPAIAHLHKQLYSHPRIGNLKDCRRSDGWTVLIHIGAAIYSPCWHPRHRSC